MQVFVHILQFEGPYTQLNSLLRQKISTLRHVRLVSERTELEMLIQAYFTGLASAKMKQIKF